MKRILDILLVLAAMPVALPSMAVISFLIAAGRDGLVFFRQVRIGRYKKPFTIYKFRTMCDRRTEEIDQFREGVLTAGSDHRITPLGRILRATSLDELPQLFNVLNGTMSLVGPRPVLPEQLMAIPSEFYGRFLVRSGITGWAQVNGRRNLDWMKQLELDSWYARHHSLLVDMRILFKTACIVLRGSGTYGSARNNWRNYLPKNETK